MVKMYYNMVVLGMKKNINEIAKTYRDQTAEYLKEHGYDVAEDGAITKKTE